MWIDLLLLALAGAAGTLCRYGVWAAMHKWLGHDMPWGTAAVNLLGCFLFGLVWMLAKGKLALSAGHQVAILVGFMGAFTTFSSFMFDARQLIEQSRWLHAAAYVVILNITGIACVLLGLGVGRPIA